MSENSSDSKKDNPVSSSFPIQEYRLIPVNDVEGFERNDNDEIDLIALFNEVWNKRSLILKFVLVGTVLGVFIALVTPKEFKSESKLLPEYSNSSESGAGGLLQQYGGLLGISSQSYSSSSNAIRVDLYPIIVASFPFQRGLAETPFYFTEFDTTTSLMNYYQELKKPGFLAGIKGYTIGLPGKIIGLFLSKSDNQISGDTPTESSGVISISEEDLGVINLLRNKVEASLDTETGIISVNATMDDPLLSAQVVKHTINELTIYLTDYQTEKIRTDLEFIEQQLALAKTRFEKAQEQLAIFREQYQGNLSIRNQTELQELNSEYQLAFGIYNTFSQKYEESKLKLQEETPLFKVLEPVQIPLKDETSGAKILIITIMLSGMLSLGWIILQHIIVLFKEKNTPITSGT